MSEIKVISQTGKDGHYIYNLGLRDYQEVHQLQQSCQSELDRSPKSVFHIFCSHEPCLTIGRGKESQNFHLPTNIDLKLHPIHRGGGVTFHHPGQWIYYVIRKLDAHKMTVKEHINQMLERTISILKTGWDVRLESKMDPLGLWYSNHKLASIGVGIKKFKTSHGLALNLHHHEKVFNEIKKISPCGLSPSIYSTIEKVFNDKINSKELTDLFIQNYLS